MLFPGRDRPGVLDGSITVAYRAWKRPTVRTGGTLRSFAGVLAIDAVDVVSRDDITEEDARRAGAPDLATLLRRLKDEPDRTVYRISFHREGEDPRFALRDDVSPAAVREVVARLDALDARSPRGAWTRPLLELLRSNPEVRAEDLARSVGREKLSFKRDVRVLKELGLTESLPVGYRLSPRGEAVLEGVGLET